jgi:exonuclease SbcC
MIVLQDKELAGIEASLKLISEQVVSNEQLVLKPKRK